MPFMQRGDTWLTLIGVDLDTKAGEHAAEITFHYADGRARTQREPVTVNAQQFPTTEFKVEDQVRRARPQGRGTPHAEGQETADIYATLTPEMYWSEPFHLADRRRRGRTQLRPPPRLQWPAAGAARWLDRLSNNQGHRCTRPIGALCSRRTCSTAATPCSSITGSACTHVFALLGDQSRAGHCGRARPAHRARGRHGRVAAAPASGACGT